MPKPNQSNFRNFPGSIFFFSEERRTYTAMKAKISNVMDVYAHIFKMAAFLC